MDILVINLMRLGDLVQTGPVLRRLHQEYPGSRVSLLVMDLFAPTVSLLPGVDRLLIFPSTRLAALLEQPSGWPEAASHLVRWLKEHIPRRPDLVINLTPTWLGSILAYLTGAPEIRGIAVNSGRELVTRPAWASYTLIVSRARWANPFNLVDLFVREAGLAPDGAGLEVQVPEAATREVRAALRRLAIPKDAALVGLLPGASQPERCWPAASFARTAALLLKNRPCHFFLLGSAQEAPLGEAILRELPRGAVTSLLGQTTPPLLAAYLKGLNLLITNDTGPMHLAAAVGTLTLALFLASARVQDTGPVGAGHVILEPHLPCHPCLSPCPRPLCHQTVSPEVVAYWAEKLLQGGDLSLEEDKPQWRGTRIYLGTTDPQGYQVYLPLVRRPLDRRHFWLWLHRWVWGEFLDGAQPGQPSLGPWILEVLRRNYLPPEENPVPEEVDQYLRGLVNTAGRGEKLAREIAFLAEGGKEFPVRLWLKTESLKNLEQSLRQLAVAVPELSAHLAFFFQEQRGVSGKEIIPLARELERAYARLRRLGELTLSTFKALRSGLSKGSPYPAAGLAQTLQSKNTRYGPAAPEWEGVTCT